MDKGKHSTYSLKAYRYGVTNGFTTLFTMITTTYWAVFLTSAVGIETAIMATILSVSSLVDLISLPICGVVLQKSKFKSGKFRPWLLFGGVVTALCRWLSFTDLGLTGAGQAIWFGGTYILSYVAFNLAYSAFTGILPLMAKDPSERVAFSSARTTCNSIGKFLFSASSVSLIALFGSGNESRGYCLFALLIAVLGAFGFIQLYFGTKDIDVVKEDSDSDYVKNTATEYDASIWEMIKYTISKPFLLYLLGSVAKGCAYFTITGLATYYYSYVIGSKSMLTVFLSLSTFLMIGASFITPYINKITKNLRYTYIFGLAIYGICLGSAYFIGNSAVSFTVLMSLGYIGYAFAHSSEVALYSMVIDYTEWKNNKDLKPFMMSLFSLTPKIGTSVGSAILGFGLVAIGFTQDNITQPAISGIRGLMSGLPAIIIVIGIISILLFPITDDKLRKMQVDIDERKKVQVK